MKRAALWALAVGLASVHGNGFADPVVVDDAPAASSSAHAQIDFILDNPLPESEYAESKRCVFPNSYRSVEILDTKHLLFWGYRGSVWLNQLRFECLGLRRDALLVFEMRDRTLCDMDSFQGMPRSGGMGVPFAVHCLLGNFETISEDQAEALRVALARHAQSPTPTPTSTPAPSPQPKTSNEQ
jgi:hypothetical protein